MESIIEMRDISKSFGEIQALKNVDFNVGYKEIVGLVGDNGAGKTTLIKILTGVYKRDKGEIYWKGKKIDPRSPADAIKLGIETVHQQEALIAGLNIRENLFLGREIVKKYGPISLLDEKKMDEICIKILKGLGMHFESADREVSKLSGGERQAVAIGRCMHFGGEVLVLDEPTASLSLKETDKVLDYLENAKKMGRSIILISHIMRHVYPIADRFVILDRGRKIGEFRKGEISQRRLEEIIITGRV